MTKIPDVLYRTKEIKLGNNQSVQIKGHRGSDFNILRALNKIEIKTIKLHTVLAKISTKKNKDGIVTDKKDGELTDKDFKQLMEIREDIDKLQEEARPHIHQLAQRGLKRFYYPDKKTGELDDLPDIELNEGELLLIHQAMNDLDKPLVGDDGEGKSKKK